MFYSTEWPSKPGSLPNRSGPFSFLTLPDKFLTFPDHYLSVGHSCEIMFAGAICRMAPVRSKILIIEDDRKMSAALVSGVEGAGYDVTAAGSAEEGFFLVHSLQPDLLLLDLTLPQRNGLDILKQIRKEGHDIRVLILTSHNTIEDRVEGLRTGADDYLGKPFSFPELMARINALLRRFLPPTQRTPLIIGDLSLDTGTRTAARSGEQIDLTSREFDLLLYLAENHGRTVSREMLAKDVWRETSRFTPIDNVIDVQVARLRRKIDDRFSIKLLQTIRGLGYSLKEPQP
jgi:DNA-binding response OmpR family regulator